MSAFPPIIPDRHQLRGVITIQSANCVQMSHRWLRHHDQLGAGDVSDGEWPRQGRVREVSAPPGTLTLVVPPAIVGTVR